MVSHLAHTIAVAAHSELLAMTFDVLTESFDDYLGFDVVVVAAEVLALGEFRDAFVLVLAWLDFGLHFVVVVASQSCETVAWNTFAA